MARQAPSAFVERLDAHHIHRERGDHHELAAGRFGKRACQVVARRTQIERCFERQDGARGHALHLAVHHHVHVIFLPIRAFLSRCRTYEHRVHGQKRGRIKREAFRILLVRCKECGQILGTREMSDVDVCDACRKKALADELAQTYRFV